MASEIKVDTISEKTSANGVTIDGVNIKDSALATAGSVPLSTIDIDGGTDIGAAIVDADLFIIDDGAGGTNRKVAASRIKTYAGGSDPASADGDTLGTASLEWSDLYLADSSVIYFGNDQDTTLTHTDGTGLTLNSTNKLCFNDASQFVQGSSATVLSIGATDEIDLTATAVDLNGTLDVSGNSQFSGTITVGVDDTGKDVKFFGATASSHMLWDESADDLNLIASGIGIGTAKDLGIGLHVRESDSGAGVNGNADHVIAEASGNAGMSILTGTSSQGKIAFGDSGDSEIGKIVYDHSDNSMKITTNASEAMRIDSAGRVGINFSSSNTNALKIEEGTDDEWVISMRHSDASNPMGIQIYYSGGAPDNTTQKFIRCLDTGAERFQVLADGDCNNHDNTFGSISDERIKQDIRDANSQWDDIKAVKVRNFKKKDDVRQYGAEAWEQIGIIAQELESVSPKLIKEQDPNESDILSDSSFGTLVEDESNPVDYYEEGDVIPDGKKIGDPKSYGQKVGEVKEKVKSIKYSILYMKAIKALQEAQTRIETLEAKVAVLEG